MVRRSKLEIYVDVLSTIGKGQHKPTHIMYQTNLSWGKLQTILTYLTTQDFIMVKMMGQRKSYEINEKGEFLLSYFGNKKPSEIPPIIILSEKDLRTKRS